MRWFRLASMVWVVACGGDPEADAGSDAGPLDAPALDVPGLDAPSSDSPTADTGTPDPGTAYGAPVSLGALSGVPETSGIVASRDHAGIFWVHNDSGNPAEIYAIDGAATIQATFTLTGAMNRDWEDITLAPDPGGDFLYVGDHGDNLARTSMGAMSSRAGTIQVYRLREPDPTAGDAAVSPELIELAYPDGPHDCEAMFADPATGDLYLVSKVDAGLADLYVARAPITAPGPLTMEHLGTVDFLSATAADMSTDGTRIALRNYGQIRVFSVTGTIFEAFSGTPIRPMNDASPAEAIAFAPDGYDLFTIAEGNGAQLFQIPWE